ncbi:LysM domain-containing protein [Psilocybe cubensis]|uniref:LysM domain-containing protein n=1 Tax=Psilocybe cubensis TaxID=181762 RepID=A0ACB8GXE1_PSICU|nr:LysM domain-containing protein [Psilocybe cubensis]KAH9480415.1 LysM domain-containing protein [Psilocybe cubensis]
MAARAVCLYLHIFLPLLLFLGVVEGSDFHQKLRGKDKAHNDAFHSGLLKQLADSRKGTTGTNDTIASTHKSLDLEVPNAFITFATDAVVGLQIYTADTLPTNPAPSTACASALTATIPYDLDLVCTNDCLVGLESYRAGVVSACGNYVVTDSSNNQYPPTLALDYVSGPYTVQCLKDPVSGAFCGPIIKSYNTTNGLLSLPTSQLCTYCTLETLNATLSNPTSYSVDLAGLLTSAITTCGANFNNYNVTTAPSDQVVLSVPFGVNATDAPTIDCTLTGRNITASQATTCAGVAAQYSVSEYDVFSSNPSLNADCTIPAGSVLCIPQQCTTYTIAVNDTCQSVAKLAGKVPGTNFDITASQIQSFNPDLGTYCQLMSLRVGKKICLSPNGGWPSVGATTDGNPSGTPTAVAPIPTPTVSGTTSACGRYYLVKDGDICQTVCLANSITFSDFLILNPEVDANCTNLWLGYNYCVAPYPPLSTITAAPLPTTNYTSATIFSYPVPTANYTITYTTSRVTAAGVAAPTNIADGTRPVACGGYYDIQAGDTLDSVTALVGVNASLLATWNLELASGSLPPVGSAICILFPEGNYTLPVAPRPANAYANAITSCAQFYTVQSGDGCGSIESSFALTNSQFDQLNPGLTSDCTNLVLGLAYCVLPTVPFSPPSSTGPPDNVAPGTITDGCTSYYTVQSGDTCSVMENNFNITLTQITTWNPEINSQCTNIQLGLAYCVASSSSPPSTGPPSNVAPGTITDGCTTYYTVVSGDSCSAIESNYDITFTQLITWNPEINSQCTNIQVGLAYCVASNSPPSSGGPPSNVAPGTITTGCTSYYTVVSGDTCSAIESRFGITMTQLTAWNPEINSQCTNIQLGLAYCVASSSSGTSPTGPPENLASGSLSNCTSYHTVVSGDSCAAMESTAQIAAADFFRWNPEVSTDCSNILVGEAYCVGGGGNPCQKFYVVQPGDFCFAITQSQQITQQQLNALNPFLDSNCDLSVGESLCVG